MGSNIRTIHSVYTGKLYFLLAEKIWLTVHLVWFSFLFSAAYLLTYVLTDTDIPMNMHMSLLVFGSLWVSMLAYYYILPPYIRGKFLRNKGYCIITPENIEAHCLGKMEVYEYKERSIKVKQRKDGSTDIFIGMSLIDLAKHSGFLMSSKFFKADKAARAIGAPLYRVTNAEEILTYLKANS